MIAPFEPAQTLGEANIHLRNIVEALNDIKASQEKMIAAIREEMAERDRALHDKINANSPKSFARTGLEIAAGLCVIAAAVGVIVQASKYIAKLG